MSKETWLQKQIQDAENGNIESQKYLDYHRIKYKDCEDTSGKTKTETAFQSPRQKVQPKTKKLNG